jgi:hypothetical protein
MEEDLSFIINYWPEVLFSDWPIDNWSLYVADVQDLQVRIPSHLLISSDFFHL